MAESYWVGTSLTKIGGEASAALEVVENGVSELYSEIDGRGRNVANESISIDYFWFFQSETSSSTFIPAANQPAHSTKILYLLVDFDGGAKVKDQALVVAQNLAAILNTRLSCHTAIFLDDQDTPIRIFPAPFATD